MTGLNGDKLKTNEQLREIYGEPKGRTKAKVLSCLEQHSINFLRLSPFVVISTFDKNGNVDASPRGGNPGFVVVKNEHEIILPDSKGNNRIDSLINILETGRIGALFLIPGVDETLRINGCASVSKSPELLDLFSDERNPPKTCIVIDIDEVFLHCAKAFMRSKLWSRESQIERSSFPTIGQMLKDQIGNGDEPESHADMVKRYQSDL